MQGRYGLARPERSSGGQKRKFYFQSRQEAIFSFADAWDTWTDPEGGEWKTYSIITTEPNKKIRLAHNRMPVILHQEEEAAWLEPSRVKREGIEPFLYPLEDNGLNVVEVSSDVNAIARNAASHQYE